MQHKIYLDNNATTALHAKVIERFYQLLQIFGNASSMHSFGRAAKTELDSARAKIAELISASSPDEIIFTSGGTESDNLAVIGVAEQLRSKGNHIITSAIEHPAVMSTCNYLMKRGYEITYLPVDHTGLINPKDLEKALTPNTILVSIMLANNEIGTVQPITELSAITKKHKVLFHTDAVQAMGKIPVNVQTLGVDLLSLSGHKFHGPKGVGVLYVRKGLKLAPQMHGGKQEQGMRSGTYNVPGIASMALALSLAVDEIKSETTRQTMLREKLFKGLEKNIPEIQRNGHAEKCLPNTLNVTFKYIEGESMLLRLDHDGIAVSTGSACASGSLDPSHVLLALGLPHELAHGSIRFSLSRETKEADIEYTIEKVAEVVKTLRAMSPLYNSLTPSSSPSPRGEGAGR